VTQPLGWASASGGQAIAVAVGESAELPAALAQLGLTGSHPVLVLVGGANGLDPVLYAPLLALLRDLVPVLREVGALVVDGGTESGVMALMGQAVAGSGLTLLGVVAAGTLRLPGNPESGPGDGRAGPDPNHHRFLLVPGEGWGDESPWLAAAASAVAGGRASLTLVIGGGKVTLRDLREGLRLGRPALILAGTGGTANAVADALNAADLSAFDLPPGAAALCRVVDLANANRDLPVLLRQGLAG
jgi:hypothetical protein